MFGHEYSPLVLLSVDDQAVDGDALLAKGPETTTRIASCLMKWSLAGKSTHRFQDRVLKSAHNEWNAQRKGL
jgi:hypothetical protein